MYPGRVTYNDLPGGDRITTVGLLFETSSGLRRIFEQRLVAEYAVSAQAFDVLIRLARSRDSRLRMSELAAQSALSPSGLTRAVDRLEQVGLVSRATCPDDRRGAFAVLTEDGHDLMERAIPLHRAHIAAVLDEVLTPAEEARLSDLLRKLRDHIYGGEAGWAEDGCVEETAGVD